MVNSGARANKQLDESSRVAVGRIGAAHGVRGEVRLQSFCADPADLARFGKLLTDRAGLIVQIQSMRPVKQVFVARLKGVETREQVEKLNGVMLFVAREELPQTTDPDEFYYADLIGLEARLKDGTLFGTVRSVDNFGAGDLLEIALAAGGNEYFAFTRETVPHVDIGGGYVTLVPPDSIEVRDEE